MSHLVLRFLFVCRAHWSALAIISLLVLTPTAFAQDMGYESEPAQEPAQEEETPPPSTEPAYEPPPPAAEPVAPAEEAVEEAEEEETDWTDQLSWRVFADGYIAGHWTLPNSFEGNHATDPNYSGELGHRAYDVYGGPSISFAGLDVRFAPQPVGGAIDLRFGTSVPRLLGAFSGLPEGLQFLKQAYVSWRPFDIVQIDFGQFDTIYGAEVSESWLNPTYTRGSLYNVVQPFYHAGFRVAIAPVEWLTLTAILVNGWNNVMDNNDGKSGGVQATMVFGDFTLAAGYMLGPEQTGVDDRFRHLVDVIVRLNIGDLQLAANGDLVAEDFGGGTGINAGGMLSARYLLIPEFAIAGRVEYLATNVGADAQDVSEGRNNDVEFGLFTGTLTLEAIPDPHLSIRLDNRIDVGSYGGQDAFINNSSEPSGIIFSTVLGMVVHSD